MKIVLVLALALGVVLFPEKGTAVDPPKCYECGRNGIGFRPAEPCSKLTDKLTDAEKEKFEATCYSEYCETKVGYDGKIKEKGCYYDDKGLSAEESLNYNNTLKGMQRVAECLKSKGIDSCYSDWHPDCSKTETTRKRRDTGDGDNAASTDATPPAAGADDKQGEKSTGTDADGTKKAPSGSPDGRSYQAFVPSSLTCLCKGSKCNLDDKKGKFHKCYECTGTIGEGKEDPCINLDTEKANQIECPGQHCGIYKYKIPGAKSDEKGISSIRRGCAPVGAHSESCFEKQGEEVDKATCGIGKESNSLSTYAKVLKCLRGQEPKSRTSLDDLAIAPLTIEQHANTEYIFCVCKGELCNDSGKGSHLVLSNGVVMLGLMMMTARTGNLI